MRLFRIQIYRDIGDNFAAIMPANGRSRTTILNAEKNKK
jgi:hypothetical protein